jgi:tRNA-dihydrouridine synthase A
MTILTASRRLCVAPMMERTDRHCRYLLRQLAPDAWLYTEMITAAALLRGDAERLLAFDAAEHPVALQLGGSEPEQLAAAAELGAQAGYDEININVGCPSPRVQSGAFGVALMREPQRVADCVRAMSEAVAVPVTVKTRIGVDTDDDYGFLRTFVDAVVAAGCRTLVVHARKAWLHGLSPKENRNVPPLNYPRVYQLKRDYPELEIVINGGLNDADTALAQLAQVDGIMLGRAAYHDPFLLAELNRRIYGEHRAATREDALAAYIEYAERELDRGTPLKAMSRHLMGLYANRPGAREWRRTLSGLAEGHAGLGELSDLSRSSRPGRYNAPTHRDAIVQSTAS